METLNVEEQICSNISALQARVKVLEDQRDDALGREASVADTLNTWARESSVETVERAEDARVVADRLWAKHSHSLTELARYRDAVKALTPWNWKRIINLCDKNVDDARRLAGWTVGADDYKDPGETWGIRAAALRRIAKLAEEET